MNNEKIRADKYIIDTFIQLTKTYPIKQISVTKIVDATAINRRTFYDYFYSKENLIETIDEMLLASFLEVFSFYSVDTFQQSHDLVEKGEPIEFNIAICQHIKNYQSYYLQRLNENDFITKFIATLSTALFPFSSDTRTNSYLAYGTIGFLKDWLQNDCRQPVEEIAVGLANAGFHTIYNSMKQPSLN